MFISVYLKSSIDYLIKRIYGMQGLACLSLFCSQNKSFIVLPPKSKKKTPWWRVYEHCRDIAFVTLPRGSFLEQLAKAKQGKDELS